MLEMRRFALQMLLPTGSLLLLPALSLAQAVQGQGSPVDATRVLPAATHPPFGNVVEATALLVIGLALIVAVSMGLREWRRHRLLTTFIERGLEIPTPLLPRMPSRQDEQRRGTWLTCLGAGVGLVLYIVSGDPKLAAWCLIPLLLGLASFVNAALFYRPNDPR